MNNPLDDAINSGAGHSVPRVRSLPNTEHDLLCPPEWQLGELASTCSGCKLISLARADERRKIENERSSIWSEAMDAD